jgi:D-sedoheptulose 7-phosphate isomerase
MTQNSAAAVLTANIQAATDTLAALAPMSGHIGHAADLVVTALREGHKVMVCGNGGSAAEAAHLAGELVGRYKHNRRPYPCICLPDSPAIITCIANDFHYDEVFARQVRAFAQPGDVLIVFSSSGASPNIAAALDAAKAEGAVTVAFLGKTGGACKGKATAELMVPGTDTARIQEGHQLLMHTLCDLVEQALGHE